MWVETLWVVTVHERLRNFDRNEALSDDYQMIFGTRSCCLNYIVNVSLQCQGHTLTHTYKLFLHSSE